ncbi:MAG: preprotein translocase subunit SecG [Azoarcus sp.]|jgi:preprotein translocase subunit SecG|nr:preprotein translocase subunit SecG [Azoarcus sp.]
MMGGSTIFNLTLLVHVLAGVGLIVLVLFQHGKGADMGASFGSGASGSLFGASGSANFLSRSTAVLATVFFMTTLSLSYLASQGPRASSSVIDNVPTPVAPIPAESAPPVPIPATAPGTSAPTEPSGANTIPE